MSIEKVKEFFERQGIQDRIIEVEKSTATVELAALALNCEPQRIAKTLSFHIGNQVMLIVVAGDAKIDNRKYRECFGDKPKMLNSEDTTSLVGHSVGGICPFAVNESVSVYLDDSLKRFKTVFPAAGSSNSGIELTLMELEKYSNYNRWVDVCKGWDSGKVD
ncbi:MAG: YbaK/EbsC family protein [Dethiobacter sp.]|jgi:prolyl-tRNA editing enzyme YbaK/EbsC (Cys-tRNA(Pro) deacylase)|nr:YbaK/EbsC family protein [Dethiobacter sp.]MBS3899357.1 YbaK/EbsC family protein [Dethiobacter sp.]MBS3982277.1 YbaK/EbsC family protein [Dethiobacter sp.]MCL4463680.1 YbaK/EbsC family protein [Bacillota bacterium]MCL5993369.1 YbaK/EbsC family protein [Bacillota bacterium]